MGSVLIGFSHLVAELLLAAMYEGASSRALPPVLGTALGTEHAELLPTLQSPPIGNARALQAAPCGVISSGLRMCYDRPTSTPDYVASAAACRASCEAWRP